MLISQAASMKKRAAGRQGVWRADGGGIGSAGHCQCSLSRDRQARSRMPVTMEKLLYAIPHDGMQNTYGHDQRGEKHASIGAI
jgi:hypothetical protein